MSNSFHSLLRALSVCGIVAAAACDPARPAPEDDPPSEQGCDEAECGSEDGCCPADCSGDDDPDCAHDCGNGELEGPEKCDGENLGDQSCESLGFEAGTLACAEGCLGLDTSACPGACAPDCSGRVCGADPACGTSCGECPEGGTCNSEGQCDTVAEGAPRILEFSTNVNTMRPTDTLVFSAIVSDPDGIDDVIGGTLKAPGGGTYGTFRTEASEGAYALELSWGKINQVKGIEAAAGGSPRVFRAEFFDAAGHTTAAELTITMRCAGARQIACDGECLDGDDDPDNCGKCGKICSSPAHGDAACSGGACAFDCDSDYHQCGTSCASDDAVATCGSRCQACPAVAHGTPACLDEKCSATCEAGYHVCNGACVSDTDPATCGGRCTPCSAPAGATATCNRGICGVECPGDTVACGVRSATTKETFTSSGTLSGSWKYFGPLYVAGGFTVSVTGPRIYIEEDVPPTESTRLDCEDSFCILAYTGTYFIGVPPGSGSYELEVSWDAVKLDRCVSCTGMACKKPYCNIDTGACRGVALQDGTSCEDGNSCTSGDACEAGVCKAGSACSCVCYPDSDRDGEGGNGTTVCGTPTACPSGYVSTKTDCCDTDSNAKHGQTQYFGTINRCNSWDYDCSGSIEKYYTEVIDYDACFPDSGPCTSSSGFPPNVACGASVRWERCTCTSLGSDPERQQRCR